MGNRKNKPLRNARRSCASRFGKCTNKTKASLARARDSRQPRCPGVFDIVNQQIILDQNVPDKAPDNDDVDMFEMDDTAVVDPMNLLEALNTDNVSTAINQLDDTGLLFDSMHDDISSDNVSSGIYQYLDDATIPSTSTAEAALVPSTLQRSPASRPSTRKAGKGKSKFKSLTHQSTLHTDVGLQANQESESESEPCNNVASGTGPSNVIPHDADVHDKEIPRQSRTSSGNLAGKEADPIISSSRHTGRGGPLPHGLTHELVQSNFKPATGLRCRFRANTSIDLNYDAQTDVKPRKYFRVSDYITPYLRARPCEKCGSDRILQTKGVGMVEFFEIKCTKCTHVVTDEPPKVYGESNTHLAIVYEMLLMDKGSDGISKIIRALQLSNISKSKIQKIKKTVYFLQEQFYTDNLPVARNIIRKLYEEFYPDRIDKNGKVYPFVAVDGTYSQKGHHARYGLTFMVDLITGLIIDFTSIEMCRECPNKEVFGSECLAPVTKFHGSSGQTEGENCYTLFKRAPSFNFYYTDYVADGDAKVAPRIHNIYRVDPNDINSDFMEIRKHECWNHIGKQIRRKLAKFFNNWSPPTQKKAPPKKDSTNKGGQSAKAKALLAASKSCQPIGLFFSQPTASQKSAISQVSDELDESQIISQQSDELDQTQTSQSQQSAISQVSHELDESQTVAQQPDELDQTQPDTIPIGCITLETTGHNIQVNKKMATSERKKLDTGADTKRPKRKCATRMTHYYADTISSSPEANSDTDALHIEQEPTGKGKVTKVPKPTGKGKVTKVPKPTAATRNMKRKAPDSGEPAQDKPQKTVEPEIGSEEPEPKKPKITHPLKKAFTAYGKIYRLEHLITMRLRQHKNLGIDTMRQSINSVIYHERDHENANNDDRIEYHKWCTSESKCPFYKWVQIDEKDPNEYVYHRKTADGEKIKKGYLADPIFEEYPTAWEDLRLHVEGPLGPPPLTKTGKPGKHKHIPFMSDNILKSMQKDLTQNQSESIHSKMWSLIQKSRPHNHEQLIFAAMHLVMTHNFLHYRGSLYHKLGMMGPTATQQLKQKDKDTLSSATWKWMVCPRNMFRQKYRVGQSASNSTVHTTDDAADGEQDKDVHEEYDDAHDNAVEVWNHTRVQRIKNQRRAYTAGQGDEMPGNEHEDDPLVHGHACVIDYDMQPMETDPTQPEYDDFPAYDIQEKGGIRKLIHSNQTEMQYEDTPSTSGTTVMQDSDEDTAHNESVTSIMQDSEQDTSYTD